MENSLPSDSSTKESAEASKENAGEQRGKPYYEKLRADLRDVIKRKRENDRTVMAIETQISRLESQYLEETHAAGNIIKGFDNYIKASGSAAAGGATGGTGTATRRKGGISDQDRIFSRSSVSWNRTDSPVPPLNTNGTSAGSSGPGSSAPTPTTTGGRGGASGSASARDTPARDGVKAEGKNNKKKKAAAAPKDQDEDSERPSKKNKISWGRD